MNPVFVILVLIGFVLLFVALMPLFSRIGGIIVKRWNDTFNNNDDEEEEEEK